MVRVLGLLPVRSGSKGLPGKNSRLLGGKPLLSWAAEALVGAPSVDRQICSTDSPELASLAEESGLEVPFLRPSELASDTSLVIDTIQHALSTLAESGDHYTHVVLTQATSPTVTATDIEDAMSIVTTGQADTVFTASRVPEHFHPALMFSAGGDGLVDWALGQSETAKRRQDWAPFLIRRGLVYVFDAALALEKGTMWGSRVKYLEVAPERGINIDTEDDFRRAERYFQSTDRIS